MSKEREKSFSKSQIFQLLFRQKSSRSRGLMFWLRSSWHPKQGPSTVVLFPSQAQWWILVILELFTSLRPQEFLLVSQVEGIILWETCGVR